MRVADGPNWKGLAYGRGIVWDPGIVGLPRLRLFVCCDCLCLIPLFRDVLLFVRSQTDSSAWANDVLSLQCVRVRGTPVDVITHVKAEILAIRPSDRVGGSMGRFGWLLLVSRGGGGGRGYGVTDWFQ